MSSSEWRTGSVVVVGVDGSADSARAVEYAVGLAAPEGLTLRMVHAAHEFVSLSPYLPYLPEPRIAEIGQGVLADAAQLAAKAGHDEMRIESALVMGATRSALLNNLDDARAVVLGTRSPGTIRLLTGSTSTGVAGTSPVPVRCVPREWNHDRMTFGEVTVGLEVASDETVLLEEAFLEAERTGAAVRLVHAWRPMSPYDTAIIGYDYRRDWEDRTHESIETLVTPMAAAHPEITWTIDARYDRPASALHHAAMSSDLVIVGRHGHMLPTLSIGSTARALLHGGACPIAIIPTHHARTDKDSSS